MFFCFCSTRIVTIKIISNSIFLSLSLPYDIQRFTFYNTLCCEFRERFNKSSRIPQMLFSRIVRVLGAVNMRSKSAAVSSAAVRIRGRRSFPPGRDVESLPVVQRLQAGRPPELALQQHVRLRYYCSYNSIFTNGCHQLKTTKTRVFFLNRIF